MLRAVVAWCVVLLFESACWATPYWVDYEASSGQFPETQGWTRIVYGGGAQRWFSDDALVIDSRASTSIEDAYRVQRPGSLDPGPGEVFMAQWGLRVEELHGPVDPGVWFGSDAGNGLILDFAFDHVDSPSEYGAVATFAPGVFHDYELRSSSMLTYDLYCDGILAHSGTFYSPAGKSTVGWGDVIEGATSLADWSYYRFGVLPEPDGVWMALSAGLAVLKCARARRA